MFLRVLFAILCLGLLYADAKGHSISPISASFTNEFEAYSCDAQVVRAVLKVVAQTGGAKRSRVSLTSVMDLSGSMRGKKMRSLRDTNLYLANKLSKPWSQHKFGVVTFSQNARELVPLEELKPETLPDIQTAINGTATGGRTNIQAGLRVGMEQQINDTDAGKFVRVVFLFTDGKPTFGVRKTDKIIDYVKELVEKSDHKILIYTFAVGNKLEVKLLDGIADVGSGVMYGVANATDMPAAFGSAIGGNTSSSFVFPLSCSSQVS